MFGPLFFPASSASAPGFLLAWIASFGIAFMRASSCSSRYSAGFGERAIASAANRQLRYVAAGDGHFLSAEMALACEPTERRGLARARALVLAALGSRLRVWEGSGGAPRYSAVENAPPGYRARYGMFPQLGAPMGFISPALSFLILSEWLNEEQFIRFGWRIPFLRQLGAGRLSACTVRLSIHETPVFRDALARRERVKVPMLVVFRDYPKPLIAGTISALATFVLFYLVTVFALAWGTTALGYTAPAISAHPAVRNSFFSRRRFRWPAVLADRYGRRRTLLWVTAAIGASGFVMAPLMSGGQRESDGWAMALGLSLMG